MPWGSSFSISSTTGSVSTPSGTSASMCSTFWSCSGVSGGPAPLVEPLGEGREMALGQLQPGGRGVAAEGDQALGAVADRLVEVEARNRPRRALGELVAEGHDDGRAMVEVDQPAGHDADHAGMPALPAQDDRPPVLQPPLGPDHLLGFAGRSRARSPGGGC